MEPSLGPVQREVLGDQVAHRLREAIVGAELAPGTHLVEDALATQFAVSRGPVRDALRLLEAEGLVQTRRRGAYVVGIGADDIDELYSLRGAVEALAARLAIGREDADWEPSRAQVQAMHAAASSGDREAFARADVAFHSFIYQASGHRRLLDIWRQYEAILASLLRRTVLLEIDLAQSAADHETLLDLLRAGDENHVVPELTAHLERSRVRMLQAHASSPPAAPTTS